MSAANPTPFTLAYAERSAIVRAMVHAAGVKTVAAKLLGCGKSTLYRKLRQYEVREVEYLPTPTPPAVTLPQAPPEPVRLPDDPRPLD